MRQRKVKNEEERLAALSVNQVKSPEGHKGMWHEVFGNAHPIYVEIGCGKGQFALTSARLHPELNYIGIEGQGSVILRALEKVQKGDCPNILFTHAYIREIEDIFAPGELTGLFLNFSDPWPKDRHAKRRLAHSSYLSGYKKVLKADGTIEIKTDNDELFAFAMTELQTNGFNIIEETRDLHGSSLAARFVTTEYEDKFRQQGRRISYCKFVVFNKNLLTQ
jgi:tRNA (guanine-N7-)-methyltransferase